ncbi:putative exopolygalacturonase B [Paramyrothecium foliicola]|nr:putative exopolygalacturonase B [Paramyrothecium foliicola]
MAVTTTPDPASHLTDLLMLDKSNAEIPRGQDLFPRIQLTNRTLFRPEAVGWLRLRITGIGSKMVFLLLKSVLAPDLEMHFFKVIQLVAATAVAAVHAVDLPAGVPSNVLEFRDRHPYAPRDVQKCRTKITIRPSEDEHDDVSAEFEAGVRAANNGGTLYLPEGDLFVIGKVLDLTGLSDIHIHLDGEIRFTDDVEYWQKNAWYHPFQKSIMFWKWGGHDIKIFGKGVIEGQGQRWWNEFDRGIGSILNPDNKYYRPILFYAENTTNLDVSGIHMKDSPCWNNFIVSSKNVRFTDVVATALSNNGSVIAKNTDFMNTMNTSTVRIERVWVNIDDDCFSPKPNSSDLYVNTMYCNGTHGQSMGSLGQYYGEVSNVHDVHIENVWMMNGDYSGARIKVWAGKDVGTGYVNNVTFKNFWVARMDYGIFLDSCYFNKTAEECAKFPAGMDISNIHFENFTGYTSGVYGNAVARLACAGTGSTICENITIADFDVKSPCGGEPVVICDGVGDIGIDCVPYDSEEAQAALAAKCKTPLAEINIDPWGSGLVKTKKDAYHPISHYVGDDDEDDDGDDDCES